MNIYYKMAAIGILLVVSVLFLYMYIRKYNRHLNQSLANSGRLRMMDPSKMLRTIIVLMFVSIISLSVVPSSIKKNAIPDNDSEDNLHNDDAADDPSDETPGDTEIGDIIPPNDYHSPRPGNQPTLERITVYINILGFDQSKARKIKDLIYDAGVIAYVAQTTAVSPYPVDPTAFDIVVNSTDNIVVNIEAQNDAEKEEIFDLVYLIGQNIR